MQKQRVRTKPRISVNKLGEYMVAPPLRRERIVADQKRPREPITLRYDEAQKVVTRYLVGGAKEATYVRGEIERLYKADARNDWEWRNHQLCAEALEAILDFKDDLSLDGLELNWGDLRAPKLQIGGVAVSVRPEITISKINRAGQQVTGAIKLYFPKTQPLTDKAGEYVATTVHQFMVEQPPIPGKRDHRLCRVIDVSQGKIFAAPLCFKRRRADIEAACREIFRAWEEQ